MLLDIQSSCRSLTSGLLVKVVVQEHMFVNAAGSQDPSSLLFLDLLLIATVASLAIEFRSDS